ncbi:hypothetical protein [Azospirillum sp. B510]|nr:hypothetical protein [Azospirillum sp. B510]
MDFRAAIPFTDFPARLTAADGIHCPVRSARIDAAFADHPDSLGETP